jgi:hypothetical protein
LLTKEQAAAYCGVSVPTFTTLCKLAPVALGTSARLMRYDIRHLDRWIDGLSRPDMLTDSDWLARMDDDGGSRAGH